MSDPKPSGPLGPQPGPDAAAAPPAAPSDPAQPGALQKVQAQPVPEINLSSIIKAFTNFAADPQAGQRVDKVLDIWKEQAAANAKHEMFAHATRLLLSVGVLGTLAALAWNKTISGGAVTAILGALVGYLWGEKNGKREKE